MTLLIILFTVVFSIIGFSNQEFTRRFIFNAYLIRANRQWYRFVTCGFLHADFLHLLVNMFVLYSFGNAVEQYYSYLFGEASSFVFLVLYISAIAAANATTFYKYQHVSSYNSLGASGAVAAILFTSILFSPLRKVYLYGIIGLPGILMGIAYLAYSYYMTKRDTSDHINHDAHFYGAVYGIAFTLMLKPKVFQIFIQQLFGG